MAKAALANGFVDKIGSRREYEQRLAQLGCSKINLQVRAENAAVAAFYRSLGYEVEERVSMGKRLAR